MPSNWLYIDTNFPSFTGEESPEKKIDTIQSYLFMLVEQLRYSLRNLDFDHNMNQTALQQFIQNVESPINTRITDVEKGLETQIIVTAEGIQTRVTSLETDLNGKIQVNTSMIEQTAKSITSLVASVEKDLDGKIQVNASQIEQTATEITAQVVAVEKDLDGKIQANSSEIKQTATSLTTMIQSAEGDISKLEQKVDGFTLSVTNKKGASTLSLKSGGVTITTSGDITLGGDVIFKSSLTDGTTTISGDNIKTGKIKAEYIDADVIRTGNLKDGTTTISGDNIKTGKIKADYIDVDSIKLKYLYGAEGGKVVDASQTYRVEIGKSWPTGHGGRIGLWGVTECQRGLEVSGSLTVEYGVKAELKGDVKVGGSTSHKVGFFGSSGAARQTVAANATVATLISALKAYGLIG